MLDGGGEKSCLDDGLSEWCWFVLLWVQSLRKGAGAAHLNIRRFLGCLAAAQGADVALLLLHATKLPSALITCVLERTTVSLLWHMGFNQPGANLHAVAGTLCRVFSSYIAFVARV